MISHLPAVGDTLERRVSFQMPPVQWQTRIELLQSFTEAAEKAAARQEKICVRGLVSAVLVAGTQPLTLNPPTVITIPDPSQSETDLMLTDTSGNVTVKPVSEEKVTSGLSEAVSSPVAPHEDKSVDSFHSLTEEMDNLNHDVDSDVAAKNGPSTIPEEELSEQPTSPR
jgi:hypothetical protein